MGTGQAGCQSSVLSFRILGVRLWVFQLSVIGCSFSIFGFRFSARKEILFCIPEGVAGPALGRCGALIPGWTVRSSETGSGDMLKRAGFFVLA
jgi:hypothetical protein